MRDIFYLLCIAASLVSGCAPAPQGLAVMSSGGFTAAYQVLSPEFAKEHHIELHTVYGASMGGAPSSIPERLARGESADMVILASEGIERLISEGRVWADTRVDLASSLIGMCVRSGAPQPNITTVDSFRQVLLQAKSVAYSASASGTFLSTVIFPRLGIAAQMMDKSKRIEGERVGAVVARGEAAIGFQQVSELLPIEGIDYVGTIPREVQKVTTFSAGITTTAKDSSTADALIRYLSSPQAADAIGQTGMVPLVASVPTQ